MLSWVEHEKSFITSGPGHASEGSIFMFQHYFGVANNLLTYEIII